MFKYKKPIIFMILGSLGFAAAAGGKFPYFVFYTILLSVVIPFLWTVLVLKRLNFSQGTSLGQAYVGDVIEVKTRVYNESLLPVPYVEVRNEMVKRMAGKVPGQNVLFIMPLGTKSISESISCRYRGFYQFGPVSINISDVFGMFSWNKNIKLEGGLTVYPKVAKLNSFKVEPIQTFGTVTTKQRANEDYSSISDIRKYYPGDSFKKIHWKVSARKGALYVKNFDMSGSLGVYIFLNMFWEDYEDIHRADLEEKAVECAAAIVRYMLSRNTNTAQYVNCEKAIYTGGRDLREFKKFMDGFVTLRSNGTVPMAEFLESRMGLLIKGSSIILITPRISETLNTKAAKLRQTGFEVIIIYTGIEELDEKYIKLFSHYDIKLQRVGIGDDVKASLEG